MGNEFVNSTKHVCVGDKKIAQFQIKLKAALEREEIKVPKGEHYLGSSEVIESLFGKFKAIEGHHASSGLTSSVLAIPALVGKLDENTVAEGLKSVSSCDIEQWIQDNMGQTFLSQSCCFSRIFLVRCIIFAYFTEKSTLIILFLSFLSLDFKFLYPLVQDIQINEVFVFYNI